MRSSGHRPRGETVCGIQASWKPGCGRGGCAICSSIGPVSTTGGACRLVAVSHGGAWGTQAWIDPVRGVAYILMVQRSDFPNSDASPVRRAFQQAASEALSR